MSIFSWDDWKATLGSAWRDVRSLVSSTADKDYLADKENKDAESDQRITQLRVLWDRANEVDQMVRLNPELPDADKSASWELVGQLRSRVLDTLATMGVDNDEAKELLGETIQPIIFEQAAAFRQSGPTMAGEYGFAWLVPAVAIMVLCYLGNRFFDDWDAQSALRAEELKARVEAMKTGKTLAKSTIEDPGPGLGKTVETVATSATAVVGFLVVAGLGIAWMRSK